MKPWPKVRLGEVLSKSDETITPRPDVEYSEVTVRLWGKGVVERGRVLGAEISANRRFVARQGQFIASRIDARNGAMGIVPRQLDGSIVTNDFPLFNPNCERLSPEFLRWLCRTRGFVERCLQASEGTTNRVRLKEDRFLTLEIPLPPLQEQRRIVARIEELSSLIDEARTLRQQTVKETELLIANARATAISGCNGANVHLADVCADIIDNLHSNPRYAETGIPCIRSPDVGYGELNLDRALKTNEEEYARRTVRGEPRKNDIMFVREGGGTGKCALVEDERRFSLGQRVMMLRPDKQRILPKFFLYQLLSPLVQEAQIVPLCKGSASPHLNIGSLKQFNIHLPAISEQQRIVEKLDLLQAEVNSLKDLQPKTTAELTALLLALFDREFRGEWT